MINNVKYMSGTRTANILKEWFESVIVSLMNDPVWNTKLNFIKDRYEDGESDNANDLCALFSSSDSRTYELQSYPSEYDHYTYPRPNLNDRTAAYAIGTNQINEEYWHRFNIKGHRLDGYEVYLFRMYKSEDICVNEISLYSNRKYIKEERILIGYKLKLRIGNNISSCIIL